MPSETGLSGAAGAGSGGGGGGGDASAANQLTTISRLDTLITDLATRVSEVTGQDILVATQEVRDAVTNLADGATVADLWSRLGDIDSRLTADALVQTDIASDTQLSRLALQNIESDADAIRLQTDGLEATSLATRLAIDPEWEIAGTESYNGKPAKPITLIGQRTAFNSLATVNDIGNHLGAAAPEFVALTGTEALEIVSGAAADTAAGSGIRTVLLTYIDPATGFEESDTVTLNGTTAVSLGAIRMLHLQRMEAATVGLNGKAVGLITLRLAGAGATIEQILANETQAYSARYMVPTGKTAYARYISTSARNQDMQTRVMATILENGTSVSHFITHNWIDAPSAGSGNNMKLPYHKFPAGTKIKVAAIPANTTGSPRCTVALTLHVVDN